VLHCDNTIGAEYVVVSLDPDVFDDDVPDYTIGETVVEFVTYLWDESPDAEWVGLMRDDVGSVWRIDLRQVGRYARECASERVR
jgi:hypothetical protein